MSYRKEDYVYVGVDLHKETHTAVILDCWNTKLGEITFANTPAEFPKLVRKVKKYYTETLRHIRMMRWDKRHLLAMQGTKKCILLIQKEVKLKR